MTAAIRVPATDFSLVLGGPLDHLFRRAHLAGDALELWHRRVLVLAGLAWLPLLLLSTATGEAMGGPVAIPFVYDIEVHVRFLVALPILVATEVVVHRRIPLVVAKFVHERIVAPADLPAFEQAIAATVRARNSTGVELGLLLGIFTLGLWASQQQILALGAASWYGTPMGTHTVLTPAGRWYAFVSIPMFQFILLRWYFRFVLWFGLLWRISQLRLVLRPLHPDRAAGLGFLRSTLHAFAPILVAQSALLAGQIASLIVYAGRDLTAFKTGLAGVLALFIAAFLGPLTVFAPGLWRARQDALGAMGSLAGRCVEDFEHKWLHGGPGSSDLGTLSNLGSAFRLVQDTRLVPFGWSDVTWLAAAAALPFLPLTLTAFSLEELVKRLIKVLL